MPIPRIEFTREQDVYLLSHYQAMTQAEMAKELGMSAPTVARRLRELGIVIGYGKKTLRRAWSEYELNYLIDHWPMDSAVDIGDHLGLNPVMVRNKAKEMGLEKAPDYDKRKYTFRYVKKYKHNITKYKVDVA
jgi:hypothetical protein